MTEAQLVTYTGLLAFALSIPPLLALSKTAGFAAVVGNRQETPVLPEWANRARRAQSNLIDTMVPFLALVVAANMANISTKVTAFGIALFFWSRVAHAVVYLAGIPYLRTAAWLLGASGIFLVASALVPLGTPNLITAYLF